MAALFFIVALLYSSVGFGGGSSYIALLLLASVPVAEVRFIALSCNIIVVSVGVYHFHRQDAIAWTKVMPIVSTSVPLAFIGGMVQLSTQHFKLAAAILLVIAASLMLKNMSRVHYQRSLSAPALAITGGALGFGSGIIGIGGGIFLAPLLHLFRWHSVRGIAATASVFILFNSIAGLLGQMWGGVTIPIHETIVLGGAVAMGGIAGSYVHSSLLSTKMIKILTAVLVGYVGVRILLLYLTHQ